MCADETQHAAHRTVHAPAARPRVTDVLEYGTLMLFMIGLEMQHVHEGQACNAGKRMGIGALLSVTPAPVTPPSHPAQRADPRQAPFQPSQCDTS